MSSQDMLRESGQSASAGIKSRSVSPSPHPHHQQQYIDPISGLGFDPSIATTSSFSASPFSNNSTSGADSYVYNTAGYLSGIPASQTFTPPTDQNFAQSFQVPQSFDIGLADQFDQSPGISMQQQSAEENYANLLNSNPTDFVFSTVYQNHNSSSDPSAEYNSSLLDPQVHHPSPQINQAVNPADLIARIPSPHSSTSPQIPQQEQQQHSSTGPMSPPSSNQGAYYTPQHSRHTSLDPVAAAYMASNAHPAWQAIMGDNSAFQGHRRAPSEVSEVSSAAHSPYASQHESFDGVENKPSPLLTADNDPSIYDNALGIDSFTLSEHQHPHQQQGFSPAHSPYISPQLMPHPGTDMVPNMPFLSSATSNAQYQTPPADLYANGNEGMLSMASCLGDIGQASQMAPPSINVEFAPPSRVPSFGPAKPGADLDSLSPPPNRPRSKSDPYTRQGSRLRSSSTSSSLEPLAPLSPRSLSPFSFDSMGSQPHSNPSSREPSPSRHGRRLSTSSIENRNYVLSLADPQRPGTSTTESNKRAQKHPATFQCHLCPKRFTRAYNLRSHLRTHTDERPFVCTVCGKAFARQHDRKRHEGLHSGEKKFICRGELSVQGGQWGCGRRFARADALGRHFRSEAGRICIKALLDEESQERNRLRMDQQQQHHNLQPIPQPMMVPGLDGQHAGNFILPAALLAQYPALQNLQWDQIAASTEDASDIGNHSGFDASSGGEFGFDDDESGISSVSGMSGGYPGTQANLYAVNNQGQMMGVPPGDPNYADPEWGAQ